MIKDYIILDNVIPKKYQDEIERLMLKSQFCPWYLVEDVSYSNDTLQNKFTGFAHVFKNESGVQSKLYDFLLPLVYAACEKAEFNLKDVLVSRAFLQLSNTSGINNAHIDTKIPHLVVLYYVNDSSGPTVLYNEKYPDLDIENLDNSQLTVLTEVEPKKGRCLVFDGSRYHASSGPEKDVRCIINFDLV
jgi:hypothetical protein